jgi:hypothetical protein
MCERVCGAEIRPSAFVEIRYVFVTSYGKGYSHSVYSCIVEHVPLGIVYSRDRQLTARGPYAARSVVSSGPPTQH